MNTAADNPVSPAPLIEMTGATAGSMRDPRVVSVEGIDWVVNAGEYWVLAGLQGSGKSDMLSLTAGLMPPQAGRYRLFGRDMPLYDEELLRERLRLGLVFDGGRLLHNLTVRENIALPLRYHRDSDWQEIDRRVNAMLEATELTDWADSTPGNVSRNLQKRAGLARALMLEPELLLLDNPLGGLDLRQMQWWLHFLSRLSKGGFEFQGGRRLTLVVTAEDLRLWRGRADHFALLENHRFIVLGSGEQLSARAEPLVRELLAESPPGGAA